MIGGVGGWVGGLDRGEGGGSNELLYALGVRWMDGWMGGWVGGFYLHALAGQHRGGLELAQLDQVHL